MTRAAPRRRMRRAMAALGLALLMPVAGAQAQRPEDNRLTGTLGATAALFEQALYWLSQNQPERALQTLDRILLVEPDNVDAMVASIEAAALAAQPATVQRHLENMRRLIPGDPRLATAEEVARLLSDDAATLIAARQLATAGRQAEAVERYRQLAGGRAVPVAIANEYYQALAATSEQGYRTAVAELQERVSADPNESRLALLLAELLTYREDTRSEGIDRMQFLSARPGIRDATRSPWRQALLWSGDDPETAARINAYLLVFTGQDGDLDAKLERIQDAAVTPGQEARALAWARITEQRLTDAEVQFERALLEDPEDAEALVGLAVIRKIQNRFAEAREFLDRAIAFAPDRQEEFERSVGSLDPVEVGVRQGPPPVPASVLAWRAMARNDLDRADRLARVAARQRGEERIQGELILGSIALQRGDLPAAEQRFRAVLALRPRQEDALQGLYTALQRQNRFAEAESLRRETGLAPNQAARVAHAGALVENARRLDHPEQALEQLRAAIALNPANPWPTVDLVRRLKTLGQAEEARRLERGLEARTDAESSMAAALLAFDDERFGDALALFERVPARLRNPDMARIAALTRREFEAQQLEDAVRARRPDALRAMVAAAGQRDPGGLLAPAIIRALARLDEPQAAVEAAQAALRANPDASVMSRIQIAGALIQAKRPAVAQEITSPLTRAQNLTAEERRELNAVLDFEAMAVADDATVRGRFAEAEAALTARDAQRGAAPAARNQNLAMVRLLMARRRLPEARRIVEDILREDPRNQEARIALVDIAVEQRDWATAHAALVEGAFFSPGDLRMTLAEARLNRAQGNQAATLRLMEAAAARRLSALRADGEVGAAAEAAEAMRPGAGAARAVRLTDSLTSQIAQELIRARDEAAVWLQTGVQIHSRPGSGGTSRLTTLTAPTEVSAPLPGLGGRLTLGADMVALRSGTLGSGFREQQSFGTNPLFLQPNFVAPAFNRPQGNIDGVALRMTWLRENMRAEVGSTPLGFHRPTFTGMLEVVPRITEGLRLRLTAERTPETSSMLSYAGYQQSSGTGPFWGAVTRTGGRITLEYSTSDRLGFYGGGGAHMLRGTNVVDNTRWEVFGGVYYAVLRQPGQQVTVGVDLRHTGHSRNAGGFTFGHGGYFSPARSFVGSLQGEYRAQWGDWTFRGIGAVGWQSFRTALAPVFPTNRGYQAALEAQAAAAPGVFDTHIGGQRSSGPTGSIFANLEYAMTPNLRLGAAARYERVGNFADTAGFFYLRYRLDRPRADLEPLFAGAPTVYPNVNDPMVSSYRAGAPELVRMPSGATRPVW
ncbi:MAG TPA: cellulose synthase subunit BcsC-related outer membrane protein [Roseococcus sp.]|jgi:tetratricopeptide (TPR) repeat protein|nr:cellulose synthase subunit BcsC-related outer membrane protein [Roseococcus sp.]